MNDFITLNDVAAGDYTTSLLGGSYGMSVSSTFDNVSPSVTLNILSGDGVTWIAALPIITANGYATISLPAGQYQVAIVAASATSVALARILQT